MRRQLLFCLILLSCLPIFSQTAKIDSLEIAVEKLHGKSKVKALNELAKLMSNLDPDAAEIHLQTVIKTAKAIGDWRGLATGYDNLGTLLLQKSSYLAALDAYQQGLEFRQQIKDNEGLAQSKMHLGKLHFLLLNYDKSTEYLHEALSVFEQLGDPIGAAQSHESLGDVYSAKLDFTNAENNFKTAYELRMKQFDLKNGAENAGKLANLASRLGKTNEAIEAYKRALKLAEEIKNERLVAEYDQALAACWLVKNDLEKSTQHLQASKTIRTKLGDQIGLAENLILEGELAAAFGDIGKSENDFAEAAKLIENQGVVSASVVLYRKLAAACARVGDYRSAHRYEVAASSLDQQLIAKQATSTQTALQEILANDIAFGKQQEHIKTLEIENANHERIRSFMFLLIGLTGVLTALVFVFFRKKQVDNQLLVQRNEEILRQKADIDEMNNEANIRNISLEMLNKKLVEEMAERENLQRSSFDRDRFLVSMSHEMRNPLNIITGLTHLLLENNPRADQVELLRNLQFAANELVVFINDVLDFSKIEAGKLDLQSREFDLQAISDNVFNGFVKKAEQKGLLFYCSFDSQIPRKLLGDDARVYQVLSNLLTNCHDNTAEGMIRAEVFSEEQKGREVVVRFVIESSDGGIHQSNLPSIRHQLGEADNSFDGKDNRLLKLAITKRLIELQHGRLQIENVYGEATRFTVLLPFKLALAQQNNIIQLDLNDHSHLQGSHILLVEDNKINQLVVAKMLRSHGMSVVTADNGLDALEHIEEQDFDLVLMDIQLPEMDGYRTTAEIRNMESPRKQNVPIIALTSSAFLTEKEKAVLFGMNDHVGKPFSPEELLEKISACLEFRH